jgi:hypothetical protein
MKRAVIWFLGSVVAMGSLARPTVAQQASPENEANPPASESDASPAATGKQPAEATARERRLADYLDGCKFVGRFTLDGSPDASPKAEEYTISRCEKLPEPDLYRLTARIEYGDVNSEVPMDLRILWSGSTPVITLDSFWIPGMGTFSARVLIHNGRYGGTWQHGDKGGHLFGKIVKDREDHADATSSGPENAEAESN